jgi:hypothetical protein
MNEATNWQYGAPGEQETDQRNLRIKEHPPSTVGFFTMVLRNVWLIRGQTGKSAEVLINNGNQYGNEIIGERLVGVPSQ